MNLLPFLLFVAQVPGSPPAPGTVVAKVNGKEILARDVEASLWEWYGPAAVQEIVAYRLITEEAAKKGVKVDEKAVDDAVRQQIAGVQESLQQGQDLDAVLREQGMSQGRIKMRVVADHLLTKLAEAEFKPGEYVKASTIVFRLPGDTQKDKQDTLDKARAAVDRLKKGEKWEDVLKASTTDPNLLRGNGALDWNAIGAFPEATQAEVRTLTVGGLTSPVETPYGIQIFRIDVLGKDAKASDLDTLRSRALPKLRQDLFVRLRANATIEPPKK